MQILQSKQMAEHMKRKEHTGRRNARCLNRMGSYIVEAAICMPLFLIAILAMSSIILMYACIEDANYITSMELRRASIEAAFGDTSTVVPVRLNKRIRNSQSLVEGMSLEEFIYRGTGGGVDELIAIRYRMLMHNHNPFGLASRAEYSLSCVTRAYVGRIRDNRPMSDAEMAGSSEPVFVFPNRGERYHNDSCMVLHASYVSAILGPSLKKEYGGCRICRSRNAGTGTLVYIFPEDGDDYHLQGCPVLERHYIELDKSVAIERGYTPCLKCGG